jgi:hypothetical protein
MYLPSVRGGCGGQGSPLVLERGFVSAVAAAQDGQIGNKREG